MNIPGAKSRYRVVAQALERCNSCDRAQSYGRYFFEDLVVGVILRTETYTIPEQEMVAFAKAWDPMPMHIDKEYAARDHGGLTASGTYLLALKLKLIHTLPFRRAVIGSAGFDEVRFLRPVHPGEIVHVVLEWIDKRRSRSKPDRGIITARNLLLDLAGQPVLSYRDTLITRLRDPSA